MTSPLGLVAVRVGTYAWGECWWAQKPPWAHFCRFALWGLPHHHLQKHCWWLPYKDVVSGVPFLNLLPFLAKKVIQSVAQWRDSLACHPKDSSVCFPRSCLLHADMEHQKTTLMVIEMVAPAHDHQSNLLISWAASLPYFLSPTEIQTPLAGTELTELLILAALRNLGGCQSWPANCGLFSRSEAAGLFSVLMPNVGFWRYLMLHGILICKIHIAICGNHNTSMIQQL